MASLYMLPSIFTKRNNKNISSGLTSPRFLKWTKKKRNIRRALKKLFIIKKRKVLLYAFGKIYYQEEERWTKEETNKLNTKNWRLIEKRFKRREMDVPPAILYWFLDD